MVAICKRRIGRLGCLLGLMVAVAVLAGAVWLGRGLLGLGKPRASALLRVAMEEQPIAFRLATAPTDRDHFEIYKCTQQQLVTSRFVLLAALRNPAVAQLSVIRHVRQKHDPVVWLQKHLCVHFPGHGELMEVSIAFDDPQEAVTLVQGVVDAYLHEVVNAEIDRRRQRLGELDRAVAEKQAEVRKEREALKKLAAELGTSETGTLLLKQKLVLEDLDSARQELSHVKSEVRRLKSDLASQKALLQNADVFNKLREEVKAEKLATIQAEVKRLEAALATTTADQQGLEREVQQMRKETQTFGHVTADLAMIRADIKSAETTLAALISERDKVKVENRRPPRIQLLVPAHISGPSRAIPDRPAPGGPPEPEK